MNQKFVYQFQEGSKEMKELLGGKGANLAEMARLGIPVPPGFTISTKVCQYYYEHNRTYPESLMGEIKEHLAQMEKDAGKAFGNPHNPLLVSVRSGAAVSMPGMMDTILNLGFNDDVFEYQLKNGNNPTFICDSYRRFLQMFGNVVYGIPHHLFEKVLSKVKEQKNVTLDNELDQDGLLQVIEGYKKIYIDEKGKGFPQDPLVQLMDAVNAVVGSWNNDRANIYRRLNRIEGLLGTAVNIQAMVFGNKNMQSGTGVCFTRDPSTGDKGLYGEFLLNAQGEDVVAGIRTPKHIRELDAILPHCYQELLRILETLEGHYRDMQDIEFTIEDAKLYLLQTRNGKRTGAASVKIAVDLVNEGVLSKEEAIMRVEPNSLNQLLHPRFDPSHQEKAVVIAKGLPASPGAAFGKVVFTADEAQNVANGGEKVILVREETSPEDIQGMDSAQGILTARGGMTSHAAVVARGMGKCCVSGAHGISVNEEEKYFKTQLGEIIHEGDIISLDGTKGEVYKGELPTLPPNLSGEFGFFMEWADQIRRLDIRTNADTPKDAQQAVQFGAQGIGLCRTEHMFFEGERIQAVREMILADDVQGREKALAKILPMQREDFIGIFQAMQGRPVTVRLLDPPLHEFLPHDPDDIQELATEMGVSLAVLKEKIDSLKEFNPMLGHRGCRLGITYPEITKMQTRAIVEAACKLAQEKQEVHPEIMVPLVGTDKEFISQKEVIDETAAIVMKEQGITIDYLVGTMIEIPRAALIAADIAKHAAFFSFGTNDLTQMTFGYSRDDAGKFLGAYIDQKILSVDPFQSIDQKGVGRLVSWASKEGKEANPTLKLGICGEHGGDPESIVFCDSLGLQYVSCSPFRVPVARLAAAQASIINRKA
ncbi:MAG: pyruvate, phosphate dikinase [Caldisericia bacterium]|nr:pyruvate, phosphate dikinase [Caldisericia bacterium]MDD4614138.1 pyruvate, phosphate dikinase [Caldisericia bacterium]